MRSNRNETHMKLIYASDLHGDDHLYNELITILDQEKDVDALLLGGDLFAHTRIVTDQLQFIDNCFLQFAKEIKLDILFIPGNNDWPASIMKMEQLALPNIIQQLHLKSYRYKNMNLSGYPMVPHTPFHRKDYEARDLESDAIQPQEGDYLSSASGTIKPIPPNYFLKKPSIEEQVRNIDPESRIWLCHTPPYGGKLDISWEQNHLGSKALTNQIWKQQPILSLHGHIHEAPMLSGSWVDKIGESYCINPGRNAKQLYAAIIELDENEILHTLRHTVFGNFKL